MKTFFITLLVSISAFAQSSQMWENIYGPIRTSCTTKASVATTGTNTTVDFTAYIGKYVTIYGHDGAGAGVAVKCLQGASTVDVGTLTGCASGGTCAAFDIFANQKEIVKIQYGATYFSCRTFTGTANVTVCPRF